MEEVAFETLAKKKMVTLEHVKKCKIIEKQGAVSCESKSQKQEGNECLGRTVIKFGRISSS